MPIAKLPITTTPLDDINQRRRVLEVLNQLVTLPARVREWTTLTPSNAWVAYDPSWTAPNSSFWPPLQYSRDEANIVHLRGLMKSGVVGSVIATLPAGFRPGSLMLFPALSYDGVSYQLSRIDVYPSGTVTPLQGGNAWFSFNGVSFLAEA